MTNKELNNLFKLATCPRSSDDDDISNFWFCDRLCDRICGAITIGDKPTFEQIKNRIIFHLLAKYNRHFFDNNIEKLKEIIKK